MNTEHRLVPSENPGLLKWPVNERGRDWFVGDVHGQLATLHRGLEAIQFDTAHDRLIGVGDLVDRGRQSFETLEFFALNPWAISTLGNHEVMALRGIQGERTGYLSREPWRMLLTIEDQRKAVEYIRQMPIALEIPLADGRNVGVIHAELPPRAHWSVVEQARLVDADFHDEEEASLLACLLWSRRHFLLANEARWDPKARSVPYENRLRAALLLDAVHGIDMVIAGHNALDQNYSPLHVANRLWIDTGSGYESGRLTFVNPLDNVYVQIHGREVRTRTLPSPMDISAYRLPADQIAPALDRIRAAGREHELLFQKD